MEPLHPTIQFFKFDHLPKHLQEVSEPFSVLAQMIIDKTLPGIQQDAALQRLLESKDAAVRASLISTRK